MQLNAALRYGIIGGIFSLLFIPFLVSKSMFFPFITGKNFAFRIVVELIVGGWLVLAWRDAAYRLKFSWVLAALTVFLGILTLADVFGENPLRSFWSNYERMEGLITLLHLFAYFIVAGSVLNARLLWERFFQTSLGVSVLISAYSIFQLLGLIVINQGGARIDATFGNATYLAIYALFHAFLAAFFLTKEENGTALRVTYGGVLLLNLFTLFNTATRGAILGVLGGAFLTALIMLVLRRESAVLKKSALAVLAGIIICVGAFYFAKDTDFIRKNPAIGRLANISLTEGTSRFLVWNMAWQGVKEHPVLGWGQDNFILVFNKHYDPQMYGQEPWFDRAHDLVFDWLVAGGVLGFAAYLLIFAALLYSLWVLPMMRRKKGDTQGSQSDTFSPAEKSVLTGLLAAYFFQNIFVFDNIVSYILFFSVLAFVHSESLEKYPYFFRKNEGGAGERRVSHMGAMEHFVAPFVIVGVVAALYMFNIREIRANRALLHGMDFREAQQASTPEAQHTALQNNFFNFEKALRAGYLGRAEVREQLSQASIALAQAPVAQDIKQEFFTRARSELLLQIEEDPKNARPRLFLASLLTTYRMPEETILHLEEALKASPRKQDIYYLLANAYLNIGDETKALKATEDAFILEPKNDRARDFYAAMLVRTGQAPRAEALLGEVYGDGVRWSSALVGAYADTKDFKKVAALWQAFLKGNPNDVQAHISLGAAYVELGERQKAIAEIEKAMELSPDFRSQGEYFVRELRAGRNP